MQDAGDVSASDYKLVRGVILFRLGAFFMEILVDIGIDSLLHNALLFIQETADNKNRIDTHSRVRLSYFYLYLSFTVINNYYHHCNCYCCSGCNQRNNRHH